MADFWIGPVDKKKAMTYEELQRQLVLHQPQDIGEEYVIQPTYMTASAVAADVFAQEEVTIPAGGVETVFTGFKARFPSDYGLFAFIRSSAPKKAGLMLANGIGVIEADYFENPANDGNIGLILYNYTDTDVTVERFARIGQIAALPIKRFGGAGYAGKTRGASGSTGP